MSLSFFLTIPDEYSFQSGKPSSSYAKDASHTQAIETQRKYATQRYNDVLKEVLEHEARMKIVDRWTPSSPEYIDTLQYISERKYQRSLQKLQRLVIQRLFELHKLNLSQTGTPFLCLCYLCVLMYHSRL